MPDISPARNKQIFKKDFYARLYAHLVSNNLLCQNQYGDVIDMFGIGKVTDESFIDVDKSFDCANHEILVAKITPFWS